MMDTVLRFFQRPPPATPPMQIEFSLNGTTTLNARLEYGRDEPKPESSENSKSSVETNSRYIGPAPWTPPRHVLRNNDDNNTNTNTTNTVRCSLPAFSSFTDGSRVILDFNVNASPTRIGARGARGNHQIASMYMLKAVLGETYNWSEDDVEDLLAFIRKEARRTLDMTLPYRSQDGEAIDRICETAIKEEHWPALSEYDDCWPVRTALKLILKYRSGYLAQRRNMVAERPSDPAPCDCLCPREAGENAHEAPPPQVQAQEMEA